MTTTLAPTTLGGHTLTDLEQRTLLVVWQVNAIGVMPSFHSKRTAELRECAQAMAAAGDLLRWCRDGETGAVGYVLTRKGDWIAELLFDSGGHEFGDFIPK